MRTFLIIKIYLSIAVFLFQTSILEGQSYWFGPKTGVSLCTQQWSGFNTSALFSVPVDLFIESLASEKGSSFFGNLGYRTRGSSLRAVSATTGQFFSSQGFRFNNLVLELGGKKILNRDSKFQPFYGVAVRADYTVKTNLSDYDRFGSPFYPNELFVRKFNYGTTFCGGFEWDWKEMYRPFLELSLQTDLSMQYFQPPLGNVVDPITNQLINVPERGIRNLSFEIKVGMKFMRKVEYED